MSIFSFVCSSFSKFKTGIFDAELTFGLTWYIYAMQLNPDCGRLLINHYNIYFLKTLLVYLSYVRNVFACKMYTWCLKNVYGTSFAVTGYLPFERGLILEYNFPNLGALKCDDAFIFKIWLSSNFHENIA